MTRVPVAAAAALAALVLVGVAPAPSARGSAVAGALESTQIANFFQLLEQASTAGRQLRTMKRQLEHLIRQGKRFRSGSFRDIRSLSRNMSSMYRSVSRLYYSGARLSDRFEKLFPGVTPAWTDHRERMRELEDEKRESTRRALQQMELTFQDVENESQMYESFSLKLSSGELGQNELLEIADQLLLEMLGQLQKLTGVLAGFAHMEATHRAAMNQRRQYEHAHRKDLLRGTIRLSGEARSWGRIVGKR